MCVFVCVCASVCVVSVFPLAGRLGNLTSVWHCGIGVRARVSLQVPGGREDGREGGQVRAPARRRKGGREGGREVERRKGQERWWW